MSIDGSHPDGPRLPEVEYSAAERQAVAALYEMDSETLLLASARASEEHNTFDEERLTPAQLDPQGPEWAAIVVQDDFLRRRSYAISQVLMDRGLQVWNTTNGALDTALAKESQGRPDVDEALRQSEIIGAVSSSPFYVVSLVRQMRSEGVITDPSAEVVWQGVDHVAQMERDLFARQIAALGTLGVRVLVEMYLHARPQSSSEAE